MTVRARLTLWYGGILFVSVLLIGGVAYRHFRAERRAEQRSAGVDDFVAEEMEGWDDLAAIALWCGLPAALVGLGGGWFLMRQALAPVVRLTEAAEKLNEGNLQQQLPTTGSGDELDRLTQVFNEMTLRLQGSFARIREFTLHASHELKTPLTVLRAEMETALAEESLSDTQRHRLQSQLDEIDRLAAIVDGLTLLTRADAGQLALKREAVRLDELLRDALQDAQTLAEPSGIRVELRACEQISCDGDRHRLRQLLLNLMDNAVKYNRRGGSVTAELTRRGEVAELRIANSGPGIPADQLPKVFDRFYRGETSHNHAVEGCGLGLSIAQWITTAHHGTIELKSDPTLTLVTVTLPALRPQGDDHSPGRIETFSLKPADRTTAAAKQMSS